MNLAVGVVRLVEGLSLIYLKRGVHRHAKWKNGASRGYNNNNRHP